MLSEASPVVAASVADAVVSAGDPHPAAVAAAAPEVDFAKGQGLLGRQQQQPL